MSDPGIVAHRGGAGVWPENTLTAFAAAAALGCTLETDIRLTADGVAVCFHDDTTARIGALDRPVAALPLTALRRVCAAAGHPLVTAAELFGELPEARVVLDVKDPAGVEALAAAVRSAGAARRVCATGTYDPVLARLRRAVGPDLTLGLGWWSLAALAAGRRPPTGHPARWAFLPARWASPRLVTRARRCGLQVGVWTVDDPAEARRFVALGAGAVTTDRPDRLVPVLHPGPGTPRQEEVPCAS